jgi:hypothetical protein
LLQHAPPAHRLPEQHGPPGSPQVKQVGSGEVAAQISPLTRQTRVDGPKQQSSPALVPQRAQPP